MKLIMHVGMGKTGTSSIQAALANSPERLSAQGAEYLGLWFDMISPEFAGIRNALKFFSLPPDKMEGAADTLVDYLKQRSAAHGGRTFVISNEVMSGQARAMRPLVRKLMNEGVEVRVIAYARNPLCWLPSAYVQWSIRDKTERGPIKPYAVRARELVTWYAGLLEWHKLMPRIVTVRPYDETNNIVVDFAETTQLDLELPRHRHYSRGDDAEIFLRALYNNRFNEPVLPDVFEKELLSSLADVPRLDDLSKHFFDYSVTSNIVFEKSELFDQFTEAFGFDLRLAGKVYPPQPDINALRDRMLEVLLELSLRQARRLAGLEKEVKRMASQPHQQTVKPAA